MFGDPGTRKRLLEVAWELLIEHGSSLQLKQVAERAGVSRQALYLHFGDREGLVLALVRHMDESLELDELLARVYSATSGAQLLERAMRLNTEFWGKVAPVAELLSASRGDALAAAWRDRMTYRRKTFHRMAKQLADADELAPPWDARGAAEVLYGVSHFDSWRELTAELGWSDDQYVERMSTLLGRALLSPSATA